MFGPAVVADVSKATRGVITLRFQGQVTEAMVQNVRRHLHFLVYQAAALRRPFHHTSVWETIAKVPEQLSPGIISQFGQIWDSRGWHRATLDSTYPGWIHAVQFYAAYGPRDICPYWPGSAQAARHTRLHAGCYSAVGARQISHHVH